MNTLDLTHIRQLNLGDLLRFPDGGAATVRGVQALPVPAARLSDFVVLDELISIVGFDTVNREAVVFQRCGALPESIRYAQELIRGEFAYWAPHLPAHRDAMGALQFQIFRAPGELHPFIVINRQGEQIAFRATETLPMHRLSALWMLRGNDDVNLHPRQAATVMPAPASQPARRRAARLVTSLLRP